MKSSVIVDDVLSSVTDCMLGMARSRRLLVGVSGGRDSVVLLDALLRNGFKNLVIVHINHRLRGKASGGDAAFVRNLARRHSLPIVVGKADTKAYAAARGVSLELAARELRMTVFAAAAKQHRSKHLVLGHHAEDQAETCLFNYLRGSGAAGLAGMQQCSTFQAGAIALSIYRPLLRVRRRAIDNYVTESGLKYREDETNSQHTFTRNRIRHQLMPLLVKIMGDHCVDAILRNADILRAENECLAEIAAAAIPVTEVLSVKALRLMPLALQRRVVVDWLARVGPGNCGFAEIENVLSLIPPGAKVAKINLPQSYYCRRRAGELFVELK